MPLQKGRLVITGASGFIGRRLVERSLAQGWRVTALVRRPEALASLGHPNLTIAAWSIEEAPVRVDLLEGADAVCHLAAFVPPDLGDPSYAEMCFRVNALGSLHLGEACLRAGVRRLVYFSAGNAYLPLDRPAKETDPVYPCRRAPYYLMSKISGELFLEHLRQSQDLPVVSLRVSSPYGIGMKPGSLIARFIERGRLGLPLEVHDGGRYAVDLVSVEDVGRAALLAIEQQAEGLFNIGSGVATSTRELAMQIAGLLGAGEERIRVLPASADGSSGYPALDIRRAQALLGYEPMSLEEGLRQLMAADGVPARRPEPAVGVR